MLVSEAIDILGLSEITQKEIERNYRKKILQYHPDRNTGDTNLFLRVQEAYNILQTANNQGDLLFKSVFSEMVKNLTIPIDIKDFYYNKFKVVKINVNGNEMSIDFYPISTRSVNGIQIQPRIINNTSDLLIQGNDLVKIIKISLSDFLYKTSFPVVIFKEKFSIKRKLLESNKIIYFGESEFSITIPDKGFLNPDGTRGKLIVKFLVMILKSTLSENKKNIKDSFI